MKRILYGCFIFWGILLLCPDVRAEGIHIAPERFSLYQEPKDTAAAADIYSGSRPQMLDIQTTLFEEKQIIDFENRSITFQQVDKNSGFVLSEYRYDEMGDYFKSRADAVFARTWQTSSAANMGSTTAKKKNFNLLQMELPIQYPSWAQRILGKDPPRLTITGYEEIIVAYEYNKTVSEGSDYKSQGTGGLNFDQNNQFSVTGSVGRLINVNIKASTKQGIDASDATLYPEYAPDYWATFFTDPDGMRLEVTNYRQERRERHDHW